MSIFKKAFNIVKKIFTRPSRGRKKAGKKKPASHRKRKVVRTAKQSKAQPRSIKRLKNSSHRAKITLAIQKKTLPAAKEAKPSGLRVGEVTHYFDRIKVCVIRIDQGVIKKGDRVFIKGNKGQLAQKITSMQIENEDVSSARTGQLIGLKVADPVFVGDEVFKKK